MKLTPKPTDQLKDAAIRITADATDMYVVIGDTRIAKRGRPNTPRAGAWVSIEPGWSVLDTGDGTGIMVRYDDVEFH
jgi:hypothetical protein